MLYSKTGQKDVADSLKDLLERGREPAVFGMRKIRVRVVVGSQSSKR